MREEPIFSGGWIKAALVILVAAGLGVGSYVLASGTDINLNLPDLSQDQQTTNLHDVTLEGTTIDQPTVSLPKTQPPAPPPDIQRLRQLNRCVQAAGGDFDEVTACFDRFSG